MQKSCCGHAPVAHRSAVRYAKTRTSHLVWHGDERAEVPSVETLDRLLDDLATEAATSRSFTVELRMITETAIVMVVDADVSPVECYDAMARTRAWLSWTMGRRYATGLLRSWAL